MNLERREEKRIKINCPAIIKIGPEQIECKVYDISKHGISFKVEKRYFEYYLPRKGTEIRFEIKDDKYTQEKDEKIRGNAFSIYAYNKRNSVIVGCVSTSLMESEYLKYIINKEKEKIRKKETKNQKQKIK